MDCTAWLTSCSSRFAAGSLSAPFGSAPLAKRVIRRVLSWRATSIGWPTAVPAARHPPPRRPCRWLSAERNAALSANAFYRLRFDRGGFSPWRGNGETARDEMSDPQYVWPRRVSMRTELRRDAAPRSFPRQSLRHAAGRGSAWPLQSRDLPCDQGSEASARPIRVRRR